MVVGLLRMCGLLFAFVLSLKTVREVFLTTSVCGFDSVQRFYDLAPARHASVSGTGATASTPSPTSRTKSWVPVPDMKSTC